VDPIGDHQDMVDQVQRLGFIVPVKQGQQTVHVEQDRDPQFPRPPLVG